MDQTAPKETPPKISLHPVSRSLQQSGVFFPYLFIQQIFIKCLILWGRRQSRGPHGSNLVGHSDIKQMYNCELPWVLCRESTVSSWRRPGAGGGCCLVGGHRRASLRLWAFTCLCTLYLPVLLARRGSLSREACVVPCRGRGVWPRAGRAVHSSHSTLHSPAGPPVPNGCVPPSAGGLVTGAISQKALATEIRPQ